jgi:hypothetical protein
MTVADLEVKILELDPKERARLAKRLLEMDEAERRDQALDADPSAA